MATDKNRVRSELLKAGMNKYGLLKAEARHLPKLLHANEHIGGVIYGRYNDTSAMMVATDKRLLFLDHKLLFESNKEIAYRMLGGVTSNARGEHCTVTVGTRLGDFTLRYVNKKLATIFIEFVEKWRLEKPDVNNLEQQEELVVNGPREVTITGEARNVLISHDIGVLSTLGAQGRPDGAAVHYAVSPDNLLYMVTKEETQKAKNIAKNKHVAFTVFDAITMQTLQAQGVATLEPDQAKAREYLYKVVKPHVYGKEYAWPPLTKLVAGSYVVISLALSDVRYFDYKK